MDECYACVVGISAGPRSHSEGCPLREVVAERTSTEHRVHTRYEDDRGIWECSCGRGGSAAADRVDLASDRHISEGDRRIDTTRSFDFEGLR